MRFLSLVFCSGVLLAGLSSFTSTPVAQFTSAELDSTEEELVAGYHNRSRDTSYRGSGRRAVMASTSSQIYLPRQFS